MDRCMHEYDECWWWWRMMNDQWWWMVMMMMMNDVKDDERWWKMMKDDEWLWMLCILCIFLNVLWDPYFWRWWQRHTDWSTMQIEAPIILVKPQSGLIRPRKLKRAIFNCHLEHLPPSGGVLDSRVFFLGRLRPGGDGGAVGLFFALPIFALSIPEFIKIDYNYEWNETYKAYKVHAMITFLVEWKKSNK